MGWDLSISKPVQIAELLNLEYNGKLKELVMAVLDKFEQTLSSEDVQKIDLREIPSQRLFLN